MNNENEQLSAVHINAAPQSLSMSRVHKPAPVQPDDSLIKAKESQEQRHHQLEQAKIAEQQFVQHGGQLPPESNVGPCSEVKITLSNGKVITMAPPKLILEIVEQKIMREWNFADEKYLAYVKSLVRAVLHVSAIDDVTVAAPVNAIEYQALAQKLGNEGLDAVMFHFQSCFPVLMNKWQVVKKY